MPVARPTGAAPMDAIWNARDTCKPSSAPVIKEMNER